MGLQSLVDKRCTVQDALIWAKRGNTSSGAPIYERTPREIRVRWDAMFVEVIADDGRTVTSNAHIMSPFTLPIGHLIFLGGTAVGSAMLAWRALATYPSHPTPLQGGFEIVKAGHNPDFSGEELLYTAFV